MRGHKMEKGDIFKFVGLIAFFAIMVLICAAHMAVSGTNRSSRAASTASSRTCAAQGRWASSSCWGFSSCRSWWRSFPDEVVQIAAGMLYGPWLGALSHPGGLRRFPARSSSRWCTSWARRSCRAWCPRSTWKSSARFEKTGKLSIVVFILFLIPGLAEGRVHVPGAAHGHEHAHVPAAVEHRAHTRHPRVDVRCRRAHRRALRRERRPVRRGRGYRGAGHRVPEAHHEIPGEAVAPRQVGAARTSHVVRRDGCALSELSATETLTMVYRGQRHGDGLPSEPYGRIPWRYHLGTSR